MAEIFTVDTTRRKECIEITDRVRKIVRASDMESGTCHVIVLHATAALIVNENDDPNIGVDLITALDAAIPRLVGLGADTLVVAGDHTTPAVMGAHSWHPAPLLVRSRWTEGDGIPEFTERRCASPGADILHNGKAR